MKGEKQANLNEFSKLRSISKTCKPCNLRPEPNQKS